MNMEMQIQEEGEVIPQIFTHSIQHRNIDPTFKQNYELLSNAKFSSDIIEWHVGKGKKIFHYLSHVALTQTMNKLFGELWSYEVIDKQMYPWGEGLSPSVTGKLTLHYPLTDGGYFVRVISEIGTFDPPPNMSPSAALASCSSRALAKCCFRMFGAGQQFYAKNDVISYKEAVFNILNYAKQTLGYDKDQVAEVLKANGLSSDGLPGNYKECLYVLQYFFNEQMIKDADLEVFAHDETVLGDMVIDEFANDEEIELDEIIEEESVELVYEDITPEEAEDILNKAEKAFTKKPNQKTNQTTDLEL